jgi:hypothetical protein
MTWSSIPFDPTAKVLRQFAAAWLIVFMAYGIYEYRHARHELGIALLVLAAVIGLLGLIKPGAVRWIFVGWMVLAFPIGWLISQVMLLTIFFLVLTPAGILFRLKGRDLLARKSSPGRSTFWTKKSIPKDVRSYFRQF